RFFSRGARPETLTVRELMGVRKRSVEAEVLSDVIVLVGLKSTEEMRTRAERAVFRQRRGVRPGAALVKHFRNVAVPELVTLHPGARPSMRPRDQVFLAGPALVGGVPILVNLLPALQVIGVVLAAYFGLGHTVSNDELRHALTAASGLVAVGA